MYFSRKSYLHGFTLVEIMVAMAVMAIAALGALSYQFHCAKHARIAKLELTATRTAQLLLEDWKSNGGATSYDPGSLGMGFVYDQQNDFYKIEIDDLPMYIRLMHRDVETDASAGVTLREISVIVRWRLDFSNVEPELTSPHLVLTTYVRLDAAAG
jgi:prepilin-type N-terminal cleavage/methylation domain-containing protein